MLSAPVVNPDEIALEDDDEEEQLGDQSEESACHESNDLFFVDTKPQKRSKMSLPQPQNETLDEEPLLTEKGPVTETINMDSASEDVTGEDLPSTIKKFKRRNQELYMDQESST